MYIYLFSRMMLDYKYKSYLYIININTFYNYNITDIYCIYTVIYITNFVLIKIIKWDEDFLFLFKFNVNLISNIEFDFISNYNFNVWTGGFLHCMIKP